MSENDYPRQTEIAGPVAEKKSDIAGWFYLPSWKRVQLPEDNIGSGPSTQNLCALVFLDELGVGAKLVKLLQDSGQRVTVVKAEAKFHRISDESFAINPEVKEDYHALWDELRAGGRSPSSIIHLWCLTNREEGLSIADSYERVRSLGFNSLLFLTQALDEKLRDEPLQIKVISNHVHKVTGEEFLSPAKAILLGPCRVIPQEHPSVQCTNVDVGDGQPADEHAQLLVKELAARTTDAVVAYRGADRWVQKFEHVSIGKIDLVKPPLKEGGVYLITGGVGGIGLVFAEFLAQSAHANLVLISRTGLPDRDKWQQWLGTHDQQDDVAQKIRNVQALENLGATVLVLRADVTDGLQMKAAVDQTQDQFGQINGVIHAAGIMDPGTILEKTPETAAAVMAPKVAGTRLLGELLHESKLDFFILCSSLSAHLGGIRMVDYSSANAFLDGYAQKYHKENNIIAIDWCAWQEVGMAAKTKVPTRLKEQRERNLRIRILPEDGKEALGRILGGSYPQVIVSLQDLTTEMRTIDAGEASVGGEQMTKPFSDEQAPPRPDVSSNYIVPGNSTEQTIADVWKELLGVANVGIHDNFFELGGESALAASLIARLKSEFSIELAVVSLFENPTVHSLSEMVRQAGRDLPSFDESRSRGQRRKERMRG